jgi:glucose-6-phosphate 1-dehydrogenase
LLGIALRLRLARRPALVRRDGRPGLQADLSALQQMVISELNVPVIGVTKAGWTLEHLATRPRNLSEHGGVNDAAFAKLTGLLQYIDGDYQDPSTFTQLRQVLGSASRPTHYLAIPSARWWRRSVARAARKARAWWWRNRLDGISSPLKS